MSDPTPFMDDPLDAEGVDPDLSQDRDEERRQSPGADIESPDAESPDDRAPTRDEQLRDIAAAEQQGREGDGYAHIP